MDLSSPISSVIPSAYGPILSALTRAGAPLSGRQVAALVAGHVSRSRVNSVLGELAESGLVSRESHPPSVLYRFNREHLAAPFIEALADLRQILFARIQQEINAWELSPRACWLFGSAARGDGYLSSDIDILVVRPDVIHEDDLTWRNQLAVLSDKIQLWTGNQCAILELSIRDLETTSGSNPRLVADLHRDAITLAGEHPAALLGSPAKALVS